MKIYIAGPMRGIKDWNFPAFDAAETAWRKAGHVAFSPAAVDRALGYDPKQPVTSDHLKHVMLIDVASLYAADAIAMLPGWESSSGATVELALAQFLGLDVYDAVTMEPIAPRVKPWSTIERLDRSYD